MNNNSCGFAKLAFGLVFLAFTGLVFASNFAELRTQACNGEEDVAAPGGVFSLACLGTYPNATCGVGADLLSCNDSFTENRSETANNKYSGLNVTQYNSSITNCQSITSVKVCFEWWSSSANIGNCDISVDNQNGTNFTAVNSTCPGTSADPGVFCQDVTLNKTWTCGNFFGASTGNRSRIKSEVRGTTGAGKTIKWDVLFFNVTYTVNTPPQIPLSSPGNNTQFNDAQNVDFNFTPIDDYNTTLNCSIYLDGARNATNSSTANNTLTNFLITGISYGSHNWFVNCTDGSLSNVSETWYFSINDTILPTITVFSPQNAVYNTTVWLNYTIVDATLNTTWYSLNGGANVTISGNVTLSPAQGWNNVILYANDSAGNENNSGLINFYFDNVSPSIDYVGTNASGNYSSPQTINFTASDDVALNITEIWVNGVLNTTCYATQYCNVLLSSEGFYSVYAKAYDNLTNNLNTTATRDYTLDFTLPEVAIASPTNLTWYNSASVTLTYYASDANLNTSWFVLDAGAANFSGNTTLSGLSDGTHNIIAYANDSAGNQNNSDLITFYIDTNAPQYSSVSSNNTGHNQPVLLSAYWTDNLALGYAWLYTNNSGVFTNQSYTALAGVNSWTNFTITLNAANGTLVQWGIYANDSAGNLNFTGLQDITTTNTPPVLLSNPTLSNYTPSNTSNITCVSGTYFDANADPLAAVFYAWYMNGTLVAGNVTEIIVSSYGAVPGDNFSCSQRVFDGYDNSTWYTSTNATVQAGPAPGSGIDSYIDENNPGTNYGTDVSLDVSGRSGGRIRKALLWFNVSSIPANATITSAVLQLYKTGAPGGGTINVSVYRVNSTSNWNETEVTWNNLTSTTTWSTAGGDYDPTEYDRQAVNNTVGIWHSWNITALVQSWTNGTYPNYGLILVIPDDTSNKIRQFASSDSANPAQWPQFLVSYTTPDVTPPNYSALSVSTTLHAQPANFSALWDDNGGVAFLNGFIFSSNNSGAWVNSSFTPFGGSGYSNYTMTLTSTSGATVGWIIYANDLNNNWNDTGIQTFTTTNTIPVLTTNPTITPVAPAPLDIVTCNSGTYFDADGDPLAATFWQWYQNGVLTAFTTQSLSLETAAAANGDNFSCSQRVFDGYDNSTWYNSTNATTTTDSTPPVITAVAAAAGSSSATITWTTDEAANSTVAYDTNDTTLSNNVTSAVNETSHSIPLAGLSASTLYYYNVTSCDRYGNCNTTGPYNFTTSATPTPTPAPAASTSTAGGASHPVAPPTATPTPEPTPVPEVTPRPGEVVVIENPRTVQEIINTLSPSELAALGLNQTPFPEDIEVIQLGNTQYQTTTLSTADIQNALSQATNPDATQALNAMLEAIQTTTAQGLTVTTSLTSYRITNKLNPTATIERSLITITISSTQNANDVHLIHLIPKSVAASTAELAFIGVRPQVLQSDPIVEWQFNQITPNQPITVSYTLKKMLTNIDTQTLATQSTPAPAATQRPPASTPAPTRAPIAAAAAPFDYTPWIILVVIIVAIAAFWMRQKSRRGLLKFT